MTNDEELPKWRKLLARELEAGQDFMSWDETRWRAELRSRRVTSSNHDTVLSLDWPHFCVRATEACGGPRGWCYTFTGFQAGDAHARKVGMVDALARSFPVLFAEQVNKEVAAEVDAGRIAYPNIRYSGSGEVAPQHMPALSEVAALGVHLWGFTRRIDVARSLKAIGAAVIFSADRTTDTECIHEAEAEGLAIGYNSSGVDDPPPDGAFVVFPLHRGGRVREVIDAPGLCPKVVHEFFEQHRPEHSCQRLCRRCHKP